MDLYQLSDFSKSENNAWLIFRIDTQISNMQVDIYLVLDLPSELILAFEIVEAYISQEQTMQLLTSAKINKGTKPHRMIISAMDPAVSLMQKSAENLCIQLEAVPPSSTEALTINVKRSFGEHFFSLSSAGYSMIDDDIDALEQESARSMIPDSYDPCSCASGKKYKFCCKKIFTEIMEAMVAAEDGKYAEALTWIAKAREIVGETAEVLCREALVYAFHDREKAEQLLSRCLTIYPGHPRANYLRAIDLEQQGDLLGAMKFYELAITYYPPSDHYHLNEAYNNLGVILHKLGKINKAKDAWEKALMFLPSDKTARFNLKHFIYDEIMI